MKEEHSGLTSTQLIGQKLFILQESNMSSTTSDSINNTSTTETSTLETTEHSVARSGQNEAQPTSQKTDSSVSPSKPSRLQDPLPKRLTPVSSLPSTPIGTDPSQSRLRRKLILRTGRSFPPSCQHPEPFSTWGLTLRLPIPDTSGPGFSSTTSEMTMAAGWSAEEPENITQSESPSPGLIASSRNQFGYINPAFETSGELVLNPAKLRPRYAEDGDLGDDEAFVEEMVVIERPIYSQKDFDQGFQGGKRPARNLVTWVKSKARKMECSSPCVRRFLTALFPFLTIMRQYQPRRDLLADAIAGLTVGIMHIPQGMAYGQLSTLPPVYGLYVSFFPVVLYFFLGTSKHVSLGTFAVISLMVGSVVDKGMKARNLELVAWNATVGTGENLTYEIVDNSAQLLDVKLKLAMSVTFAVGFIQLLLGIFKLGFLTVYLSDPLISGFTTGAACHVFTSQVKHIFGIPMGQYSGAFKLVFSYRDIFVNLPQTNAVTFIASIVCMTLLVVVKEYINGNPKIKPKLFMPVPAELIVVVLGTVISYFVRLEQVYKVKIVGDIPVGIPAPNMNCFSFIPEVLSDSIAIAIVSFAISVSMCKIFAKKHDYEVDSSQELLAYGLCNIFSSFFASFVAAVSLSRSLVQEAVGGRTQVTGLVSSSLLIVVLLLVGPYFKTLPNCILASIILVALKGMFLQFLDLKTLWSISVIDSAVWIVTFAATVFLDVDLGLLVGVGFALLTVIIRSQRPYSCLLGQVPGTDIYKDTSVYKMAQETPHIKIFRFDSALFFANAEFFKTSLYKMTVDPNLLKKKQRKLLKQQKRENKMLLNLKVDATGSTHFAPEDIDSDIDPKDNNDFEQALSNSNNMNNHVVTVKPTTTALIYKGTPSTGPAVPTSTVAVPTVPTSTVPATTKIDVDSSQGKQQPALTDVHVIILDCSTMSYVDSMGVKVLQQVITEFKAFNIAVYLAQCKSSVREMFECTNFYKTGSKQFLFVTIHDAVINAQLQLWDILGERMDSNLLSGVISNNNNVDNSDDSEENVSGEEDKSPTKADCSTE